MPGPEWSRRFTVRPPPQLYQRELARITHCRWWRSSGAAATRTRILAHGSTRSSRLFGRPRGRSQRALRHRHETARYRSGAHASCAAARMYNSPAFGSYAAGRDRIIRRRRHGLRRYRPPPGDQIREGAGHRPICQRARSFNGRVDRRPIRRWIPRQRTRVAGSGSSETMTSSVFSTRRDAADYSQQCRRTQRERVWPGETVSAAAADLRKSVGVRRRASDHNAGGPSEIAPG